MDTPPAVAVRLLTPADAAALGEFLAAAHDHPPTAELFHPHPLTREFAADLCDRLGGMQDRYFALFVGRRVAGYAMLRGWDEGYKVPSFGVCVHPQLQNAGVGHLLTTFGIEESRRAGAEKVRLTVYKRNERAAHLYAKYGFVFSEKDADSLVGVLDLTAGVPVPDRPADEAKLRAWAGLPT
jgi:ribosomal protein S18 acetylase RimI-like enzyme